MQQRRKSRRKGSQLCNGYFTRTLNAWGRAGACRAESAVVAEGESVGVDSGGRGKSANSTGIGRARALNACWRPSPLGIKQTNSFGSGGEKSTTESPVLFKEGRALQAGACNDLAWASRDVEENRDAAQRRSARSAGAKAVAS